MVPLIKPFSSLVHSLAGGGWAELARVGRFRALVDCETLGTLPLKLGWDERDTIAGWGAGAKTRQLYVDQQVAGTFESQS